MLGQRYDSQICSIARSLEFIGERWSLLIVRDAVFAGTTRFVEFQRRLGIATNVLQSRLDKFVVDGLMERLPTGDRGYALTRKGRDLAPALVALTEWGDRYAAPDGPPIEYVHQGCDGHVATSLHCAGCDQEVPLDALAVRPSTGMPQAYLDRMSAASSRL